jgi:hypothetical protein
MKYLTHRFISNSAKSLDSVASNDEIDEFKFDWISRSIIDRAKEVLHKLKYKKLTQGLYFYSSFCFVKFIEASITTLKIKI